MQTGSRAQFAESQRVHKSTVTRWDQAGKLVFVDAEKTQIDFDASLQKIGATADPAKLGVVLHHAKKRDDQTVEVELFRTMPTQPPPVMPSDGGDSTASTYAEFNRARAKKEGELAQLAKIKREEQEALLVRRDEVQRDIEALATIVAKGLLGIPARIMPVLNAEPDPGKREVMLEEQVRLVLNEFAAAAGALTEAQPQP